MTTPRVDGMAQGGDSWGGTGMEQDAPGWSRVAGLLDSPPSLLPVIRGPEALPSLGSYLPLSISCAPLAVYFTEPVSRGVREQGQPCAGLGSRR